MHNSNTIVVKIGGSQGVDHEAVCADIAAWLQGGKRAVVVHGGSARASELGHAMGHPPRFLRSPSGHVSRYTDPKTRDIFVRAVEELNQELVQRFDGLGLPGQGLTGERCALRGERKRALRAVVDGRQRVVRDDYSGSIQHVDRSSLMRMLSRGQLPVIPPLAWSAADGFLNVDGDRAAAAVAAALGADSLVLLSNVPGLLREYPDDSTLVERVALADLERAKSWAQGSMKRKLLAAGEALQAGVGSVILGDGRHAQPLRRALQGKGTWFVREEVADHAEAD